MAIESDGGSCKGSRGRAGISVKASQENVKPRMTIDMYI
jgi:hypothetical protein